MLQLGLIYKKLQYKMKKAFFLLPLLPALAVNASEPVDSVPERVVVISGDVSHPDHAGNIAAMYSRTNMAFEDPAAPRFL